MEIHTLGPRGPFRQSGVDAVSQLAHRRAGDPPPPACCQLTPGPVRRPCTTPACWARRVDGVPSDRVQSTTCCPQPPSSQP
jgi:anti-sigma factor RsiW